MAMNTHGGWKQVGNQKLLAGSSAISKDEPSGANVDLTATIKEKVGLPVIAAGKLGSGSGPAAVKAVSDKVLFSYR
jgi:hypothetical protein